MFFASYVALWLLLLVTALLVLLLYRHFGLMSMETLPGVQRDGIPVGDRAPVIEGITSSGEMLEIVPGTTSPLLLLFASPECGPCKVVAPFVSTLSREALQGHLSLEVAVVAAGDADVAARMSESFTSAVATLGDSGRVVFDAYRVRVTPFAFLVDEQGRVRSKGLCGDSRRLHDLLAAAGLSEAALTVALAAGERPHAREVSATEELSI